MKFTLQKGEEVIAFYRHHFFPFTLRLFIIAIGFLPLYIITTILRNISEFNIISIEIVLHIFLLIVLAKTSAIYWLDKLYVTNLRIIRIKWKNLFNSEIDELEIKDIDFIKTKSNGILDVIPFLRYGSFEARAGGNFKQLILFRNVGEPDLIKDEVAKLLPQEEKILVDPN